jgi:hypothetical protein
MVAIIIETQFRTCKTGPKNVDCSAIDLEIEAKEETKTEINTIPRTITIEEEL